MEKVVIATTTWYESPDDLRIKLAVKTIQEAKKYEHKIVVVDSSSEVVKDAFQKNGAIVFPQKEKGMGASRRQVIREAVKVAGEERVVAWLEPEKHTFIPFLGMIASAMESQSADLAIPRRKNLKSYPLYQQYAEKMGNEAFRLCTGWDLDIWFGPRVFRPVIAHFFLDYQGEYGDKWNSIHIPVLRIIRAGKKVIEVEVDYVHPLEQTTEEEGNWPMFKKRLEQLLVTVDAVEKECKVLGLP